MFPLDGMAKIQQYFTPYGVILHFTLYVSWDIYLHELNWKEFSG